MNASKRTIGFYLGIIAAVISIVAYILYRGVPNSLGEVATLVLIAAIIEIAAAVVGFAVGPKRVLNLISIVTAVLLANALVYSFGPQMNQLGSVVSGLDQPETLQAFFTFVGVTGCGMLISIVSCFTGRVK